MLGPHLHQLNRDAAGGQGAQTLMFAFRDRNRTEGVLPVAGYSFGADGLVEAADEAGLLRREGHFFGGGERSLDGPSTPAAGPDQLPTASGNALHALRVAMAPSDVVASAADAEALAAAGLFWMRLETPPPPSEEQQSEEQALLAYPSEHTCLVANVVAATDVLRQGPESRFARRGCIPCVYLSCACNFERDESGGIFSYEIAPLQHQERCAAEAEEFEPVRLSLDPSHGCDWLGYFREHFRLRTMYEVWRGERWLRNVAKRPRPAKGVDVCAVYSLHRTSLDRFEADALVCARGALCHGGCVVVFREAPADAEPFGCWLLWLVVRGRLVIVDLQNRQAAPTLGQLVERLQWEERPRREVFFAAYK